MKANNWCHTLLVINLKNFLLFVCLFIFPLLSVLQTTASMDLAFQFKTFEVFLLEDSEFVRAFGFLSVF